MDLMNKIKQIIITNKHLRTVSKSRKDSLKLKYYQGLIQENLLTLEKYHKLTLQNLNEDYSEMINKYQQLITTNDKNLHKFTKLSNKYDNKQYWLRRAFKTKNQNNESLDALLLAYDEEKKQEKLKFYKNLKQKWGLQPYSKETLTRFNKTIVYYQNKLQEKLAKLEIKMQRLYQNHELKAHKINQKITYLSQQIDFSKEQIDNYNKNLLTKEKDELTFLNNELAKIDTSSKKSILLQQKIAFLESKIEMVNNPKIQLSVTNLKMFFGGIKAVNDITFTVNEKEIFGLIGPNGAGKTTVFNCITQFYKATSGAILYRNKEGNIVDLNTLKTHNIIKEGIARSFQNVELIWELSVLDNLLVAAHSHLLTNYFDHMLHTKRSLKEEEILKLKAFKILTDLNILEYAYRYPFGLSYGILKKIELARTLMTNPTMIILDEPAAGLNDVETLELASVIKKINQEHQVTIFLVEHDMNLVMSICDRILAISFGKKLAIGTAKEIQNSEVVKIAYLGEDD